MNQIWMREHNRVSDFFIKLNGHWDDERLHQESRRIVIAEMQHVVFNEFVPLLLGTYSTTARLGKLTSAASSTCLTSRVTQRTAFLQLPPR